MYLCMYVCTLVDVTEKAEHTNVYSQCVYDIHMYIYSHFSEGMFTYIHMYAIHTYDMYMRSINYIKMADSKY